MRSPGPLDFLLQENTQPEKEEEENETWGQFFYIHETKILHVSKWALKLISLNAEQTRVFKKKKERTFMIIFKRRSAIFHIDLSE
jgi:hypothetical protein